MTVPPSSPALHTMSAAALTTAYADGSLTPTEVAESALDRADLAAERYAAMASVDLDGALRAARESTARWRAGRPLGPADGVPISFKDSFHVAGLPRWHGTAVSPGPRSQADAAPVRRAREAGMVLVGKTTTPDYAMLMSGLSSQHGVIRNPWDPGSNPAGSSSGAGPSVVSGAVTVAVGTDMIGSVRLPAAVCGLASLKPTQGRIAYDPAGDHRSAGPMARTVDDVELALTVLGRFDDVDQYALPGRYETVSPTPDLTGRRIGVVRSLSWGTSVDEQTLAAVGDAAAALAAAGAQLVELDDLDVTAEDHRAVAWFAVEQGLPDYLARTAADRGRILPAVGRLLEGAFSRTAVDVAMDRHRIAVASERLRRQFTGLDFVLSPVLPVRAFPAEALAPEIDAPELERSVAHMGFACWFNRLGRPAGTVPVRLPDDGGVPVSVQIAGRRFDDAGVLAVLRRLERARGADIDWPGVRP
ncbi:amidase [Nakamurella leprariae]|uniref:Amidase domain-containing protein n=1 Tax=Nakamurella leprariae TaxID=2803911 RepID=A0A938YHM5_9ACTN|nr:amidase family protein [Nakamurella leprariae]MBM9468517.1 hypothetical protein [Nakamurella leprariae]